MRKLLLFSILFYSITLKAERKQNLFLKGTIFSGLSLSVAPEKIASTLDLTSSQKELLVAVVTEKSNSNKAYKINITSANLGKLKNSDNSAVLAYNLKYSGIDLVLTNPQGATIYYSSQNKGTINRNVTLSYSGTPMLQEGPYSDTITFNILAN